MPRPSKSKLGRKTLEAKKMKNFRNNDTVEEQRNNFNQSGISISNTNLSGAAFVYDAAINYSFHKFVVIGAMDKICKFCKAKKFKGETPGMCCLSGKVQLPGLNSPPEPLFSLLSGSTPQSRQFLSKIRSYNAAFHMTSFGATKIVRDSFMPTFKIQGQVYHRVGALLPYPDEDFSFLQIYFMGDQEVDRRCSLDSNLDRNIIITLQDFFHRENALIKLFTTALERMPSDNHKIVIRADKTPTGEHERRFNAPTINDVAIVIVGDQFQPRDIVLNRRNKELKRVSETHRSYDALGYPIIFWQGENGYHFNYRMMNPINGHQTTKKVSAMNFYGYRLMIRIGEENTILKCRQLFHQFAVDMYAKIESERLNYIRFNQRQLRSEEYIHLRDAINNDGNTNNVGQLIILPSSYAGSPRHMHEYSQDGMAFVRRVGRPDLFITFTCNPQWNEIKENLFPNQSPMDRHDITARVFRQKLKSLMDFIYKHHVFGAVRCWMYSVEWQKRGLPHAHILIWLANKLRPNQIDSVISAEIPNKTIDPELYQTVIRNMIHGPCGVINPESPCMIEGKCSKRYPRAFISDTMTGNDGYPTYRRRSTDHNGFSTILNVRNQEIEVDNRWIVPYSPLLSKTFNAHINVEYCNSVKSIKYICKYITKGSDMAVFGIVNQNSNDEITQYQMGRYISSNEAIWRILSFPIHERYPTVTHLTVHLENGQRVYFHEGTAAQIAAHPPPPTTLTAFFRLCQSDGFARGLLYAEIPQYYTWNQTSKDFQRRKQGRPVENNPNLYETDAVGRIYTVHPANAECYYLRLLLVNVRGPVSFEDLRTVNGRVCHTYQEACRELQLLENDAHWNESLTEASISSNPYQIRTLFSIIISTCFPTNSLELWENHKDSMTEDIRHRMRINNPELNFTPEMYNEALIMIEDLCLSIANKSLSQLGMCAPNRDMNDLFGLEITREQQYDRNALHTYVGMNFKLLNTEQTQVYNEIMTAVNVGSGGFYFLDAPGGTGKTFLLSLILATIRADGGIALALASSGIAATLLEGGRTAHSALKLPLNMQANEEPTCNISKRSAIAKLLQLCKIIIWDECTMAHKKSLEAFDRTMKDLRSNQNLFGGSLVLLAGDFRQTLPVIPRSTPADELNSCLKSSRLWRYIKKLTLATNVRVQLQNDPSAEIFSKQLLQMGNGQMASDKEGLITLPDNFCRLMLSTNDLIQNVFPNIAQNYKNLDWLSERAILAAKNKHVNQINTDILKEIPGQVVVYKSIDSVLNNDDIVNYPIEFLNSLDLPGLPPHYLQLKVGSPIMMLRNINIPKLCNGTRLAVKQLMQNVIEATIFCGKYKGEDVLIPRIPMVPTDTPFEFKRLQFPIRLAFAITINKSQGQSLHICGINLEETVFSHGQLYLGCSRVGKPNVLFIFTNNDRKTKNIVYQKALE